MLYLAIAIAILPAMHGHVGLDGKDGAVVVVDTDSRFDTERLAEIVMGHVREKGSEHSKTLAQKQEQGRRQDAAVPHSKVGSHLVPQDGEPEHSLSSSARTDDLQPSDDVTELSNRDSSGRPFQFVEDDYKKLLKTALQHVHVLRPQSLESLAATMQSLPAYLYDTAAHPSSGRVLHSVMLDSASAFYFQAKAEEENARVGVATHLSSDPDLGMRDPTGETIITVRRPQIPPYQRLASQLRTIQQQFGCIVMYTSWSIPVRTDPAFSGFRKLPMSRPLLHPSSFNLPTLRLQLSRAVVPPFAPAMSVEEAMGERNERQRVSDQGLFHAVIDARGSDGWSREVREGVRAIGSHTMTKFWITDESVRVDPLA